MIYRPGKLAISNQAQLSESIIMLAFGYVLIVMLIAATISIAEHSRTSEGVALNQLQHDVRVPYGRDALELINDS